MKGFGEDWFRNGLQWAGVVIGLVSGVGLIIAFSHGMAWIWQKYGGIALLSILLIIAVSVIVVGSGIQTRKARKINPS